MFATLIGNISGFMYSKLLIIILIAGGLWFTIRTGFVQFRFLKESIKVVLEKPDKEGSVSSFQALMVSTASRVGTGNIVGVSTAICSGGFGAVFWMWVIAIIGGASAFIESTLAQIYKRRHPDGTSYGGPAYYIEAALHNRPLALVFAVSMLLTYAGGFNMLASYNLQSTFSAYSFYQANSKIMPWIIGGILALIVGYCLLGGGKRIVSATSTIVPVMGGIYIVVALIIVIMNIGLLPSVVARIFTEAFDFQAIFGGFTGSAMMYGIKRGLFSNEAGVGSAPNAAAAASVSHPVKQGLAQVLSVFLDTLVICSATAFLCLCSGVEPQEALKGVPYVQAALAGTLGDFGHWFITFATLLFAFTTVLGWNHYGTKAWEYLFGVKSVNVYKVIHLVMILFGALLTSSLAWDISDTFNGLMMIPNLIGVIVLSGLVCKITKNYLDRQKGLDVKPMLNIFEDKENN